MNYIAYIYRSLGCMESALQEVDLQQLELYATQVLQGYNEWLVEL